MMFDKIPPDPVIPVCEGRSAEFRYLLNKKREEIKDLIKFFHPAPENIYYALCKNRIQATMVPRSLRFYGTTFECLKKRLDLSESGL